MDPEASNAANFDDFPKEWLINGAAFSEYGLGGDGGGGGETGSETSMGSVGIGGGVVGEMLDNGAGAFGAPTFLFRCISKSPTYHKAKAGYHALYIIYLHKAKTLQLTMI